MSYNDERKYTIIIKLFQIPTMSTLQTITNLSVANFDELRAQFTNEGLQKLAEMERKGAKLREGLQKKMLQFKNHTHSVPVPHYIPA